MDPSKKADNDGDSFMMAAIPRRSRPPPPPVRPAEESSSSATAAAQSRPASDAFQNMTIPRRSFSSKPQERSGSFVGSSSGSLHSSHRRPSGGGSSHHHPPHQHYQQQQHHHQQQQPYDQQKPVKPPKRVSIVSEYPFVVKIRMRGVPLSSGGIPQRQKISFQEIPPAAPPEPAPPLPPRKRTAAIVDDGMEDELPKGHRISTRAPKRIRPSYEEVGESDGLVDSEDEDESYAARPKKLRRSSQPGSTGRLHDGGQKPAAKSATSSTHLSVTGSEVPVSFLDSGSGGVAIVPKDGSLVESPPPGMLGPLWYSRECYLHIFVVEKIVGWKRRTVTSLDWQDVNALKFLDPQTATALSQKALTHGDFWSDQRKRMEVSRINITQCPVVMSIAAEREQAKAKEMGVTPMYTLKAAPDQSEEVLLVKWRGRSFMHCSWERPGDIQKLDPSNSTARHKIRRYYENQEKVFGKEWKKFIEEERKMAAALHGQASKEAEAQPDSGIEEFFPSQCLEVERIVGCDENEMDMNVLAIQRALNIRKEQEVQRKIEQEAEAHNEDTGEASKEKLNPLVLKDLVDIHKEEEPWDPEGNVRYVVKWKGLPWAEITWEYWRDIKRDAVVEAEDFWFRQKPPSPEVLKEIVNKPHPHVKDFRKLQTSTVYGLTTRVRPVAKLDDSTEIKEEEETETKPGFKLRAYQLEGVNWLLFNWWNKRSCILADEMGLGKTVQTLGFLQELWAHPLARVRGPFLIVAPLSLIGQWQSEARGWAPDFNVVLYHGSADAREFLAQQEFFYTEQFLPPANAAKLRKQHVTKFNLLITTYEVVLKDIAVLSSIRWRALIVDEAHRLKNPSSRLFAELASVPRDHCVLLTGTPLANNTEELWALLHFDDPVAFGDRDGFMEKFGQLSDASQVNELHTILKPYLLRRVKEDVEKSLPPKEEIILEVTLTPIQKKYYKAIYERNTSFLFKGAKPSNAPSLMNVMMELRKTCNHPFLVKGAEDRILADGAAKWKAKDAEGNDLPVNHFMIFAEQLVKSSGKMVLLEKLLLKLFTGGHKVLIFSQMVRVLDLLEELLKINKYRYERLDGSTSSSSRASAVDRFNRKSCQRFVMLLSTRAGGLGLNLTSADTIVIFDSDWNPQNDLQAMARAHRIGQTRKVQIFRLLTAKTYEMHMFHSASMKLGLERAVLSQQREQTEETEDGAKKMSEKGAHAKEIDELLKKGAYDIFRDEDDTEAEKFMSSDIDQLLERSSKKVTYGAASTESLGSGLGSFSKASFVTDTGDGEKDVDLDDPDFWSKAVGMEAPQEIDEDVALMIDDGVKRSRTQVQQFNPYAEFEEVEKKKQDKIALKELAEREEKERLRAEKKEKKEKKKKKKEKKEKKKRREEAKNQSDKDKTSPTPAVASSSVPKKTPADEEKAKKAVASREGKAKKQKKNDRKRALRRAANANPLIERIKQGWEVPQRNRATAAALRFGFGRFCKIRHESNLTSLPLQDIEIFVRSYTYQVALQVAVNFLARLQKSGDSELDFRMLVREWMGPGSDTEVEWLCSSVYTVMKHHMEVQSRRRFLRIPIILAEPSYVASLRQGAAFRSLRRLGILTRLNRIVEEGLDSVLSVLGHEELAKRGCGTNDLSTLDADLRSRHVSTEELSLAVASYYHGAVDLEAPACWWDRSCDIGLIIGTFEHGLGNYEAMRNDEELPFFHNIKEYAESDEGCVSAVAAFQSAASSSRGVFNHALESTKAKAALEIQAAVADAAANAVAKEQDAKALRKGGAAADAVLSNKPAPVKAEAKKEPKTNRGEDTRFVTLLRLQKAAQKAVRNVTKVVPSREIPSVAVKTEDSKNVKAEVVSDKTVAAVVDGSLPMPDSRVLDRRLLELLSRFESVLDNTEASYKAIEAGKYWEAHSDVLASGEVRKKALTSLFGSSNRVDNLLSEFSGVGLCGNQCASSHRSLDDGADYSIGAASPELSHVAYGTDAPRYLRAIGVPMNLTRFSVSALVYADESCVQQMISSELARSRGGDQKEEVAVKTEQQVPEEAKSEDKLPSPPKVPSPEMVVIHEKIQQCANLRAAICTAVLLFGFPTVTERSMHVDTCLWTALREQIGAMDDNEPAALFNMETFMVKVKSLAGVEDVPDGAIVRDYVLKSLLPHCIKLSIMGNGPSTLNARGSKGEYETAFGISQYPEPSKKVQSPLPDPCMALEEQSIEAVSYASAILRRVRLLRATLHIACGDISVEQLDQAARSASMCKNLDGLPLWWCPWMHDVALLVHAASNGLFSIIQDRKNADPGSAFSRQAIVSSMYSTFVADENALPMAIVERSAPDDTNDWIDLHAEEFPTLFILERRLAFLCAEATSTLGGEMRYDNLPMFDHGGWPRA